jgi:hypothetical protein
MSSQSELSSLCYNIPEESIYGELTSATLRRCAELTATPSIGSSRVCDLGSGSSSSLCALTGYLGANRGVGVESCPQRFRISRLVVRRKGLLNVFVYHCNIFEMTSLPLGTTHCFCFDKAFTGDLLEHTYTLYDRTQSLQWIITTRKINIGEEINQGWVPRHSFVGKMRGSGAGCVVYIYGRR